MMMDGSSPFERPFLAGFRAAPTESADTEPDTTSPLERVMARMHAGEFDRRPESIEALTLQALGAEMQQQPDAGAQNDQQSIKGQGE